jgi:hypothetical protein
VSRDVVSRDICDLPVLEVNDFSPLAMEVFDHPNCPATYPTPDISHSAIPIKPVHNDALVYLAVAVATFAAVPSLLWFRDQRHKARERLRSRVVVESIKAKMDTVKALETVPAPAPASKPSVVDVPEECDAEDVKDKKKRTKDRRKRNRDPSSTRLSKKSPRPPLPARHGSQATDYTPRAPEQSNLSSPPMPNIVSPKPMSLMSSSFHPPSPSPTRSENCSRAGRSRSASTSSTTAPLTPPSLPSSHSLPHNIIKENNDEAWALQLPHNDPAWDWDGQSSAYSSGSRAPSTSSCVKPSQGEEVSSPSSPASPLLPSAPSLVFPSLNAHPPPGASLSTQIASLTGALEASRTREDMHRREAERWSKECDLVKWRWNEASDLWRRREAEVRNHQFIAIALSDQISCTYSFRHRFFISCIKSRRSLTQCKPRPSPRHYPCPMRLVNPLSHMPCHSPLCITQCHRSLMVGFTRSFRIPRRTATNATR